MLIILPYISSVLCCFERISKEIISRDFARQPLYYLLFVKYQMRVVTTCVGDIKGWCSCARSSSCWPLHSACFSERFLFIHSFKYCLASGLGSLLLGNTEMLSKHRYATRANKYFKCKHLYALSYKPQNSLNCIFIKPSTLRKPLLHYQGLPLQLFYFRNK